MLAWGRFFLKGNIMQALVPTVYFGRITWLGAVKDVSLSELWSDPDEALELDFGGVPGTVHYGETRKSCVRVKEQFEKGTIIRNVRQLTVLSAEELRSVADEMGVDAVNPARLGANIVIEGIPDFTHLPPAARLQTENGTTLVVDMENLPCLQPAKSLAVDVGEKAKLFKRAAAGRRGVTAWVEHPGRLAIGDTIRLHIPAQRQWQPVA